MNFKGFDTGKETVPDPDLTKVYRELIGKDDEGVALQSRVTFMPNSGLKPSLDLDNHGIFAKVVADGLKGKADSAATSRTARSPSTNWSSTSKKNCPTWPATNGKNDEEKDQLPAHPRRPDTAISS